MEIFKFGENFKAMASYRWKKMYNDKNFKKKFTFFFTITLNSLDNAQVLNRWHAII